MNRSFMAGLNRTEKGDDYEQKESSPLLLRRIYYLEKDLDSRTIPMPFAQKSRWGMRPILIASSVAFIVVAVIIIASFTTSGGGTTPSSSNIEVSDGKNLLKATGVSPDNPGGQRETEEPVITTPLGMVRGYPLQSREGRQYFGFYKVPFAQPPLGDLRFKVRCNTN
jgi:hypothetical protein